MELSKSVAVLALVLGAMLVTGYARGTETETAQDRAVAREAQRRVAVAEHERRKEDFVRRCAKPLMSRAELEACRAAYRRL
jgi:hypothetical protein